MEPARQRAAHRRHRDVSADGLRGTTAPRRGRRCPPGPPPPSLVPPLDFPRGGPRASEEAETAAPDGDAAPADADAASNRRAPATETIARRAGALSDEIDFPDFVA